MTLYNQCIGQSNRTSTPNYGSGGGYSGGGYSGAGKAGAAIGLGLGVLGILNDLNQQQEQERQEELRRQQLLEMEEQARREAAEREKQRREAEERERHRREAEADAKRRQAMVNPWTPGGGAPGGAANPFDGGQASGPAHRPNPFDAGSQANNPFGCGPGPHPPDVRGCYDLTGGGRKPSAQPVAAPAKTTKIKDALRERLKGVLAARHRAQLQAQVAALGEAVDGMASGPERDKMQALLARLKGAVGVQGNSGSSLPRTEPAEITEPAPAPPTPRPPAAELSPEVAQALKDRPAPGMHRNLTEAECRKWRGSWTKSLGSCHIAPLGQNAGGTDELLIVNDPVSVTDETYYRTVQEIVAEAQKELFATPEDPTGQWMGRPAPGTPPEPEKTLFERNREAVRRAEQGGRVGK